MKDLYHVICSNAEIITVTTAISDSIKNGIIYIYVLLSQQTCVRKSNLLRNVVKRFYFLFIYDFCHYVFFQNVV